MPNGFAYVMLLAWPAIAVVLFRRLPYERALIWSVLAPYLLLPPSTQFDFPLVPPLDKHAIPALAAFAITVLLLGRRVALWEGSPTARLLLLLFVLSPAATILTNGTPFAVGPVVVPGLPVTDAVAVVVKQGILLLPFFLARRFLASEAAQREILLALVVAGVAYSIPMLLEIRLSPRMNIWVYGFFQHDFLQQVRFGGFRPIVFLQHGLWVAFFALMAVMAAIGLWRAAPPEGRNLWILASGYLAVMLVLCKTVGVLVYAALVLPLVRFAGRRAQLRIAALMAVLVIAYPILRGADLVPVETMLEQAAAIQEERASSLRFRLETEWEVLERARERPFFGWGGWGRNVPRDPVTGRSDTVMDGHWIIVISVFGWLGYIVEFGLLALPLVLLARRARGLPEAALSPYAGPLALILGINMIDLLPNATLTPLTWLVAGALLGHAEARAGARDPAGAAAQAPAEPRVRTLL
jgi:hypothetical protein